MSSKTFASQQSEITTKKKFGKNLNKQLSKPPPQSLGPAKPSSTSRNGLLLLSTKRQSSGATTSSAGGILANKAPSGTSTKPLPSLGLQNKSNTSTHDALLGAVVGASRAELQERDAWGVADKVKSPTMEATPEPTIMIDSIPEARQVEPDPPTSSGTCSPLPHEKELPSTNWEEYGGRDLGAETKRPGSHVPEEISEQEDQQAVMARKAKDRAAAKRAEEGIRQTEQRERALQRLRELDQKTGTETKPRTLFDPNTNSKKESSTEAVLKNGNNGIHTPEVDSFNRPPIQLSTFDDRDRGERGASAAPRMLYDPKSGSMVAVPTRDDSSAGRGKKERGKKGKNNKESRIEDKADSDPKRKGKRDKKTGNDVTILHKSETKKGKVCSERQFPRTSGVLYSRDDKGNFVSVDGCDGDLGYGSHSVPGGRVKNHDAYEKFLELQKNKETEHSGSYHDALLDGTFDDDANYGEDDVLLQTGFHIPVSREPTFEWVTPNDKIELITGLDDSPTLQATAKEWAPSQAALAASAARFGDRVTRNASYEDDDDGEDDGPFGLGFDPTLNMDSMIQSPSAEPSSGLDGVDFPSLTLEPAYQGTSTHSHIFAFGAGSTWALSDSGGHKDSWGAPAVASGGSAASFLNLSSENGWGGISSFGDGLGNPTLNGDGD